MNIKNALFLIMSIVMLFSNLTTQSAHLRKNKEISEKMALVMLASLQIVGIAISGSAVGAVIGVGATTLLFGNLARIDDISEKDTSFQAGVILGAILGGLYARTFAFNKLKEAVENDPVRDTIIA